jgi:hypothetical protein
MRGANAFAKSHSRLALLLVQSRGEQQDSCDATGEPWRRECAGRHVLIPDYGITVAAPLRDLHVEFCPRVCCDVMQNGRPLTAQTSGVRRAFVRKSQPSGVASYARNARSRSKVSAGDCGVCSSAYFAVISSITISVTRRGFCSRSWRRFHSPEQEEAENLRPSRDSFWPHRGIVSSVDHRGALFGDGFSEQAFPI